MAAVDIVNRVFREFRRYTGDGQPGEPTNAPLPVGDPSSGVHNPKKSELREALLAPIELATDELEAIKAAAVSETSAQADRAETAADGAQTQADRADSEADRAQGYAEALNLPQIQAGDAGKQLTVKADASGYELKLVGVNDGDKGDIIVSGSGGIWSIDANVVTYNMFSDGLAVVQPRTAATRAAIKAFNPARAQMLFLTEAPKRQGWFRLQDYADWSTIVALDTTESFAIRSSVDTSKVWVRVETEITPQMFGAVANADNGNTDDYAAVMAWFAVVRGLKRKGVTGLLRGRYFINQTMTWDFSLAGEKGGMIRGTDRNSDGFKFADGFRFIWTGSGANGTMFYEKLLDFSVVGRVNAPMLTIGDDAFQYAWNTCIFDLIVANNSPTTSNECLRLNYVLHSEVRGSFNGGGGGNPVYNINGTLGWGTALALRQAQFNDFAVTCGNAGRGIHMGNGSGYIYGNTFLGCNDIEEVHTAYKIDSANCSDNTFIGGTVICQRKFEATAGARNTFYGQNNGTYSGGSPGTTSKVGCLTLTTAAA